MNAAKLVTVAVAAAAIGVGVYAAFSGAHVGSGFFMLGAGLLMLGAAYGLCLLPRTPRDDAPKRG